MPNGTSSSFKNCQFKLYIISINRSKTVDSISSDISFNKAMLFPCSVNVPVAVLGAAVPCRIGGAPEKS